MSDLSTSAKKLFSAAKADVPSAAAKAKMWTGVSSAVGGAVGASGGAASALLSGGAAKILSVGALFGGAVTVGLAATILHFGGFHVRPSSNLAAAVERDAPVGVDAPSLRSPEPPPVVSPAFLATRALAEPPTVAAPKGADSGRAVKHRSVRAASPAVSNDDLLNREATLVAEARSALSRGDARAALVAVRTARALPAHQLDPEELAVEEQALRALGENDQANGIQVQLRLQYPEADLAR
jgi:hypothetical protein